MNSPELHGPYNRKEIVGEINTGEDITEKVGYVPSNILIENMIYAGTRLDLGRSQMYDFKEGEEEDDSFFDPTRTPGFDMADASNLMAGATARLSEQRKLFEKEEAERKNKEEDDKKQYKLWKESQEQNKGVVEKVEEAKKVIKNE